GLEESGAVQLRALRQAVRDEADGGDDDRQARRALHVRRRHCVAAPADVRRLPCRRHGQFAERADSLRLHETEMTAAGEAPALDPEDEARAAFYGLIARLFYAPPDPDVLAQIQNARAFDEGDEGDLAQRWRELAERCLTAVPAMLENEHTELFIGTGKAEVTPYLTHYLQDRTTDNPLVRLRRQLAEWGMRRQPRANEPEDHVSGICESMRLAIAAQH